jgi:hypothetical protein
MNYGELRDQIRNYSELSDNGLSDSTVAVIVQNAENRMYRETAIDAFKLYASSVTVAGTTTISVPSGLRNIRYVEMINGSGEIVNLLQKDSSFLGEYNNQPVNSSTYGEPKYWADWNATTWFVAPTPDAAYAINIAYLQQPATITSGATSTSYISTYAQDALLYCSLTETYKYLKGPADMIQVYEQSYQQAVRTFADEQLGLRRRDEYKDGELRIPLNTPGK